MNREKNQFRATALALVASAALAWTGFMGMHTAYAADSDSGTRAPAREDGPPPGPPDGAGRGSRSPGDQPRGDAQGPESRPGRDGPGPDDGPRREGPGRREGRPGGPPGVQRAIDSLRLTDDQKQKADPIIQDFRKKQEQARTDFLKQMKDVLSADQYATLESTMTPPPPARGDGGREGGDPRRNSGDAPPRGGPDGSARGGPDSPPRGGPDAPRGGPDSPPRGESGAPQRRGPAAPPSDDTAPPRRGAPPAPQAAIPENGTEKVPVTFTGGYETDAADHGRPVKLIAAALSIAPDVFRDAFSHVTPAAAGEEPDPTQVRNNKEALLSRLGSLGVTNDRLDAVSNYYRYSGSRGQMWRNTPASAVAIIKNGVVTEFTVTNPGAGYTTPPTVSVPGMPGMTAMATLEFDTDFSRNGSIKEIKLQK